VEPELIDAIVSPNVTTDAALIAAPPHPLS
jgi:hypothetical protein